MITNVIGCPPRRRLFFLPLVLGYFWHVRASSNYLWLFILAIFTSNNVTECSALQTYHESMGEGNAFWQRTPLLTQHFTSRNS